MDSWSKLELSKSESTSVLFKAPIESSSSSSEYSSDEAIEEYIEENKKKLLYEEGLYDPGSGEICTKYIALSQSSVLNHVYYAYPSVKDPGIVDAVLKKRPDKVYGDDGQELYLKLCEEVNLAPTKIFHRGLLEEVIDLRYYGIHPKAIRTMCLALANNKTVQRLDLTDNFLNYDDDACYHLGELLGQKNVVQELVLSGCRIGARGLQFLVVHLVFRKMRVLDLSGCEIRDQGIKYLIEKLDRSAIIRQLNLSNNHLSSESAKLLAETLVFNNCITHLDLSWNKFVTARGVVFLIRSLSDSPILQELNLAWTSIKLSGELAPLFHIKTLTVLNLSNNRLTTESANTIARHLPFSNLRTLDLSSNPFRPEDPLNIVQKLKFRRVPLRELFMNYIVVNREFAHVLKEILAMPHRTKTVVTHGEVLPSYDPLPDVDIKLLAMKRFALAYKSKKLPDIMVYFVKQKQTCDVIDQRVLLNDMLLMGYKVTLEALDSLVKYFPVKPTKPKEKNRLINLATIIDCIRRLWPEKLILPEEPKTKERSQKKNQSKKKKGGRTKSPNKKTRKGK